MERLPATGCLPLTQERRAKLEKKASEAVSLPDCHWQDQGEMPVIKWDSRFEEWLDRRIALADRYAERGYSLHPWDILRALPSSAKRDRFFYWNQGEIPSCSIHAAAHAYQAALLTAIALGAPLYYEAFNPIYPFYGARGGNLSGGLDLLTTAEWVNQKGLLPVSLVGSDNRHVRSENLKRFGEGKRWQAAVVLIENDFPRKIMRACRALCPVVFGAGHLYLKSRVDENGVKVMDAPASGGHAQMLAGYRRTGGKEYLFNHNSHGEIYGGSGEKEPASGAWINEDQLRSYCREMERYGYPFIVFGEGDFRRGGSLVNEFELVRR